MNIQIHQIFYLDSQREKLDAAFEPYSNLSNPRPEWCEYWIFRAEYLAGKHRRVDYCGYLSWKFGAKTGLSGAEFIRFIQDNPGWDVYFVHPFPVKTVFHKNVWLEGESHHPALLHLTQKAFDAVGYKVDLRATRNLEDTALACNFWVGSPRFWDKYMEFSLPIFNYLENDLSAEDRALLYSHADAANDNSYHPFIMERLFSTLLSMDRSLRGCAYRYSDEQLQLKYPRSFRWLQPAFHFQRELAEATPSPIALELKDAYGSLLRRQLDRTLVNRQLINKVIGPLIRSLGLKPLALYVYRRIKKLRGLDI